MSRRFRATYTTEAITVLTPTESVRKRPGMYIGSTEDGSGLMYMLRSAVDHGVATHTRSTATWVRVSLDGDQAVVEYDGPGMTAEGLEAAMAAWYGSLIFPPGPMPWAVLAALSSELEVTAWGGGREHRRRHARGLLVEAIDGGETERSGIRLRFTPDPQLFVVRGWDAAAISARLRELAALHPALTFILGHDAFRAPHGLADHARYLGGRPLHEVISVRGGDDRLSVEAALVWTEEPSTRCVGLVNEHPIARGAHVAGLFAGLGLALDARLGAASPGALQEVLGPGLRAVLHVRMREPRYDCGKTELISEEAKATVRDTVADGLRAALRGLPALEGALRARRPR